MRRPLGILAAGQLTLALAPSALAAPPSMDRFVGEGISSFSAGELCDFDYQIDWSVKQNFHAFGDPDDPYKVIINWVQSNIHRNLDTGYSLTEKVGFVETFDLATETYRAVGVIWHLRDSDGRLVAVYAGQMVMAFDGSVLKVTPHSTAEWDFVRCTALGGGLA